MAALAGIGMSIAKAASSVVAVGNGMFGKSHEESDVLDVDTLPSNKAIRKAYKLVEAQSLSLVVDEVERRKEEGRMITHAMDNTTKKGAGQFAVAGLHIALVRTTPSLFPSCPSTGRLLMRLPCRWGWCLARSYFLE